MATKIRVWAKHNEEIGGGFRVWAKHNADTGGRILGCMETTRHFTATTYIVADGSTALHHHDRLDMWLPPGGHLDQDELPREAARREVREETGLQVSLLSSETTIETEAVTELPGPEYLLLEDIHTYEGGTVGHQHIDFVFFGRVPNREVDPAGTAERDGEHWEWFDKTDLQSHPELSAEVREIGAAAIDVVQGLSEETT